MFFFFNLSFSIAIHVMFYVTAVEYLLCVGMNTDMKDEALPWSAQPRTRERHRTRLCQYNDRREHKILWEYRVGQCHLVCGYMRWRQS